VLIQKFGAQIDCRPVVDTRKMLIQPGRGSYAPTVS
jgi:hypothetical protein